MSSFAKTDGYKIIGVCLEKAKAPKNSTFCPQKFVYTFLMILTIMIDYFPIQQINVNRSLFAIETMCLLRVTDCIFKYISG